MAYIFSANVDHIDPINQTAPNLAPPIISVSAWVTLAVTTGGSLSGAFTIRSGGANANYNVILGAFTSNDATFFYANTTNITANALTLNTWYHLCGVVDSSGGILYVNGGSVGTGAGATLTSAITLVSIGQEPNNARWQGNIADVAVWSAKLTAPEVYALAHGVRPHQIRTPSLQAWWPLENYGSGGGLDRTIYNNNGVLHSAGGLSFTPGPPLLNSAPIMLTTVNSGEVFLKRSPLMVAASLPKGIVTVPVFKSAWALGKNIVVEGVAT